MDSTPTDSLGEQADGREPAARGTGQSAGGEHTAGYRETLRAPLSYWLIAFLFGLSIAIILLVMSPWWSLAGLVLVTALGGWAVVAYGRPVIEVLSDGTLKAGPATLPASALGAALALDAEHARALRTYEADPRAFLLLRSYIPTAVRVEIADPADPTPYLYLSSRRPTQLAAVVNALPR
ncbi:MAG TPA: DUF3093 domain-containing protein [Actinocrinis sp.]|uniref:DUF3093 domain-containing protein n=1 Tax=Actinocrinis sp. TaxID=1920516 RepID=UPI002DDCCBFC|nr:DUF3093 domain-containing protein [Actinocrinis sp.]HEV2344434.1 DUF3093 domain-containing protein [Actinocrinis sp.]